jgi:hypothetical protein
MSVKAGQAHPGPVCGWLGWVCRISRRWPTSPHSAAPASASGRNRVGNCCAPWLGGTSTRWRGDGTCAGDCSSAYCLGGTSIPWRADGRSGADASAYPSTARSHNDDDAAPRRECDTVVCRPVRHDLADLTLAG